MKNLTPFCGFRRILNWDDLTHLKGSVTVTLKPGFKFDTGTKVPAHQMKFESTVKAKMAVKASKPCGCKHCRR